MLEVARDTDRKMPGFTASETFDMIHKLRRVFATHEGDGTAIVENLHVTVLAGQKCEVCIVDAGAPLIQPTVSRWRCRKVAIFG